MQDSIIACQSTDLGTRFLHKVSAVIKPGSDNAKLFLKTVKKIKDLSEREGGDAARADDHLMTQRSNHVTQLG